MTSLSAMDKLIDLVDFVDSHWMWNGPVFHGCDITYYEGRKISAHRLRLILETGYDMGEGWDSAHTCEFVLCIKHTRWLTHKDNLVEYTTTITNCPKGHPYDEENTKIDNRGHRYCLACSRIKARKYFVDNREAINQRKMKRYHAQT